MKKIVIVIFIVALAIPFTSAQSNYVAEESIICMDDFSFVAGESYIISVWAKEIPASIPSVFDNYDKAGVKLEFQTSGVPVLLPTIKTAGNIIDGWQLISGTFTVPAAAIGASIKLVNTYGHGAGDIYYDDFRIFPLKANVVSYVYDPVTLKYLAHLDENNYATFYIYDEQGRLSGTKRETEKGIISLDESRISLPKYTPE